jgi:membrane-associated phospholipid phosphatase
LTILGVAMGVVLVRERAWTDLVFLVAALLGTNLATSLLKSWFDRERPGPRPCRAAATSSSFPSGHAAEGVAGLGALAILAAERLPDRRARTSLWIAVVVAGVAVGLSRIALGVHYVTDVVAGLVLRARLARRVPARSKPAHAARRIVDGIVRTSVAVCLAVAALAGCGGTDDRPDLAAPPPTTETTREPNPRRRRRRSRQRQMPP